MGNEQAKAAGDSGSECEPVVLIRGTPGTGKSVLLRRMKGEVFSSAYNPSSASETFQFLWNDSEEKGNNYLFHVHSLVKSDAEETELIRRANGVVIMVDSRISESVDFAVKAILESSEEVQIAVFLNFVDVKGVSLVVPEQLKCLKGRFTYIPGSLKTNKGLDELSNWLQLPLLDAKRKMYSKLFKKTDERLRCLDDELTSKINQYMSDESLNKTPEIVSKSYGESSLTLKPSIFGANQINVEKENHISISQLMQNNCEEEDYSDFQENEKPILHKLSFNNSNENIQEIDNGVQVDKNKNDNDSDDAGFWSSDEKTDSVLKEEVKIQQNQNEIIVNQSLQQEIIQNNLVQQTKQTQQQKMVQQRMQKEISLSNNSTKEKR